MNYLSNIKLRSELFVLYCRYRTINMLKNLPLCRYVEYEMVWKIVLSYPKASVLDIGSWYSVWPLFLARRGYKVTATDLSSAVTEQIGFAYRVGLGDAVKSGRVQVKQADARALPHSDNHFDHLTAISVLEHVPDPGDSVCMREFARVVKPGGLILITVPYARRYRENVPPYDTPKYHRLYDDDALNQRLIQPSGCDLRSDLSACFSAKAMPWLLQIGHYVRLLNIFIPDLAYGKISSKQRSQAEGVLCVLQKR